MQIDIKITEILSKVISVNAISMEEAITMVKKMYQNEDIVLDYSDFDNLIIERQEDDFNSYKDLLINKVIQYLIKDEKRHYEEYEKPLNHIYLTLLELQKLLK